MSTKALVLLCAWLAVFVPAALAQPFDPPRAVPSPDGALLATGHWDGTLKLIDATTGKDLVTEEETKLKALSRMIIAKDPRSMERLLQETDTFLSQVETGQPESTAEPRLAHDSSTNHLIRRYRAASGRR